MNDCHEETPQNAWPMLMKGCVELTPGTGFRFIPKSKRMGPMGVA
jgi:hypothetical protein